MSVSEAADRSASSTLAFLGTGVMGGPMARNLARSGIQVTAWNRTPAKLLGLVDDGVRAAESPAAAAAGADTLVTMLADGPATEEIVAGSDGPLATLAPGALWLQMATVGIPAAERLAALAAEHGVTFVDAPVLGSREPAESGELMILASGPEHVRLRCNSIFEPLGRRTVWLGEAGAGSKLKVVVNAWILASNAVLAETIGLAEHLGLEPQRFLDAVDNGELGAVYTSLTGTAMRDREFPLNFPLELAEKDMTLALEAGGDSDSLPVMAASRDLYAQAVAKGYAAGDWAEVIRAVSLSDLP